MQDVDQDHCELTIGLVRTSVYSRYVYSRYTLGCIDLLKVPTFTKVIMANQL